MYIYRDKVQTVIAEVADNLGICLLLVKLTALCL